MGWHHFYSSIIFAKITFKLGDKEWLNSEQPGYSEPFPATNLPIYFINSKQPGVSKQFCKEQNVCNHLVCLYSEIVRVHVF